MKLVDSVNVSDVNTVLGLGGIWKVIVQNSTGRDQAAKTMQTFVILLSSVFLVQVNTRIVAKDRDINTALEELQKE